MKLEYPEFYKLVVELIFEPYSVDYLSNLQVKLSRYLDFVNELRMPQDDFWKNVIREVSHRCNSLLEIVKEELSGNKAKAHELASTFFKSTSFINIHNCGSTIAYRGRLMEESELYDAKYIFHVPFDRTELCKECRYSKKDVPCLYLSKKAYSCWLESKLDDIELEKFYVSRFELDSTLSTFLDVSIPPIDNNIDIRLSRILQFPLTIACSQQIHGNSVKRPDEYLIPQLLISCIVNGDSNSTVGIKYTSSFYKPTLGLDKVPFFTNYVLPATKCNQDEIYSSFLCDHIMLTKVQGIGRNSSHYPINKILDNYDDSCWGRLENQLECEFNTFVSPNNLEISW